MPAPLPPLASIRCFEAAARHGSFTRAAEELGMTQAAMSLQVRILEDRLGGPLFLRGPRGVSLTEAGQRLAPAITEAFGQLRAAFSAFNEAAGILAISAISTFATNWLAPRLGAFQLAHPELAVRLDVSNHLVDFTREEVDVGIRGGPGGWPGLAEHKLLPIAYTPMLSPQLLESAGPLREPADLLRLPLIDPADPWWADWFRAAGVDAPDLASRTDMQVFTQNLAGSVAMAGHAVAILTPAFFTDELSSGRLVPAFPLVRQSSQAYWLVYPEARARSPKIRAFRDWILQAIGADAGGAGESELRNRSE